MNIVNFLHHKNDWIDLKGRIVRMITQLESDDLYKKENIVMDLIDIVKEMDKCEPRIEKFIECSNSDKS